MLPTHLLGFRFVALFQNQSSSKVLGSKIKAKFRIFCPHPVEIRGEVGEMFYQFYEFSLAPTVAITSVVQSHRALLIRSQHERSINIIHSEP